MPKRNSQNLAIYRATTMPQVMGRADNRCEVMLDEDGRAISDKPKIKRCARYIPIEAARYINFLHKDTRSGKSAEWVNDPESIVYGCAEHHEEESKTGRHVEFVTYDTDDLIYIPTYE